MATRDYRGCFPGLDDILLDGNKYVCKLEPKWVKKAKEELHEDPKERDAAVDQFRQWIKTATTLFCLHRPMVLLPDRDSEGRRIILWRAGGYQTGKDCGYTNEDLFGYVGCLFMCMMREEVTQVNGVVILQDGTGQTLKHTTFFGIENVKNGPGLFYNNFPARIKDVFMYNMGTVMEAFMAIIWPFISNKIKERFSYYSNLEELYKKMPMELFPKEYLPDDYTGPHAGTLSQISTYWYERVTSPELHKRIKTLSTEQFKVDEKKRPKKGQDEVASFRKLNID